MDALTLLLERRSSPLLVAPAPEGAALDTILRAGTRAPDHGLLRPYRFILAAGDGLDRLATLMQEAARNSGQPPETIERAATLPKRAPMVMVVAAIHRPHVSVPPLEQQLTAGCAIMAMQMAAVALGFGGIWRSGWPMFDRGLHSALGLSAEDQIVGFLYLGTPKVSPPQQPEVNPADHIVWL